MPDIATLDARIEALRRYQVAGLGLADPELDALAAHAAEIAETPLALVTLIDVDRQWIAGDYGLGLRETPLEWSFCRVALTQHREGLWVVADAREEPLVRDTAMVRGERPIRFYAGALIETPERVPLGTVCVLDHRPRALEGRVERTLRLMARQVIHHLELRRARLRDAALTLEDARRVQVEGELAATRKQRQLILESVGEGLHGLDRDGRVLFENRAALEMLGHPEGFMGRSAHEVVHHHRPDGTPYPRSECPIHRTLSDGVTRRVDDEVFFRADGSSFAVEYICAPITSDEGEIQGAVVSFRDISARDRRQRVEALKAEIRQASASDVPIPELAARVARALESILGLRTSVGVVDERTAKLRQLAAPSMDASFGEVAAELVSTTDMARLVEMARAGRPHIQSRLDGGRRALQDLGRAYGFQALVCVPVASETSGLITVTLFMPEAREPRADELDVATRVAFAFSAACEKRRADQALAEVSTLLSMAGRLAKVGGWWVDVESRRAVWSSELCDLYDVPHGSRPTFEEVVAFYPPQHMAVIQEHFYRCLDHGIPFDIVSPIRSARGVVRTLRIIAEPVFEQGRVVSVRGASQDVTEHYATHERLREQAELLDRAQDAILVRDLDHHILAWNKGAERLYGWTREEAVGQSIKALLYDDTTAFMEATQECLERGEWSGEIAQITRDGRNVTVMGRWSLVRDDDGAPRAIFATNTDITERKRLEQDLFRAQRLESIGTLAGGIAHDLNNVLAPILIAISALADEEADPERGEDLATILRCAERGALMVQQLLVFARGNDGRMARLHIADLVSEVGRMMRDTFPKNIALHQELPDDLWDVHADATQIHQMLTNLCVNARDAMPLGGQVTIALANTLVDEVYAEMHVDARPGPYVLIRVEDTGEGMSQEVLERAFEPFFTTKDVGRGTGLGLSTVHAIVRGHRGFINVYSEPGRGTRVRVCLPADAPSGARAEAPTEQARLPRGNGEMVLLVDDEEAIRTIARRTLERHGYRVLLASHGAEAVALYARYTKQIAVVLTDMAMPIMDGLATIVALRAMDPAVRIVGSSGLNANGHVVQAMDAGVRHFVPKPYTTEALLRVLRTVLTEQDD